MRRTRREDVPGIIALSRRVYPDATSWSEAQLLSHQKVFPAGQFVAVTPEDGRIVGMAASLIIAWDDYESWGSWRQFTDAGMFTNHDPDSGRTLYGAEVMVDPDVQGRGIGTAIYAARERLARRLRLRRIRAGARISGFAEHADRMSAEEYVARVVAGELNDPTLSFQLQRGFRVIAVVPGYLPGDAQSRGYAAVIEWLNPEQSVDRPANLREHT